MQLALAYAPRTARNVHLALFALDTRLAQVVGRGSEPIVAQLKLAWWRDRFAEDRCQWPVGEPLLASLATWDADVSHLGRTVDGWEGLLSEDPLAAPVVTEFVEGRAQVWALASEAIGAGTESSKVQQAARQWAVADLAGNLHDASEKAEAIRSIRDLSLDPVVMPRALRPMAVLAAMGRRSLKRERPMMDGGRALFNAMRVGILGR
ncbi:hypothetical protein GRI94_11315 [Erythrobacter jejuensis]|uniref:Phytoene synthase n=2 Tax=Parerythrobacter jejuensis TaxID=795812 RepID=A0A845ASS4_9SPHN|nr:hypothetical protein [Parerythrobacter jejuensis]